jgi:NtrC-family two-component system sensor histidine kinase KinB
MTLSLRRRLLLTVVPPILLLLTLGVAALALVNWVGQRINAVLRDNYDSVVYMIGLNEALERIDSSFQFALAGKEVEARQSYADSWKRYEEQFRLERGNITLPGERDLVDRLAELSERYHRQGDAFYGRPAGARERADDYFGGGPNGLVGLFRDIKQVSGSIRDLNQQTMEAADREARHAATSALLALSVGLGGATLLAVWLAWRTSRTVLGPLAEITEAAQAIGGGQLERELPVVGTDEIGRLAAAFNRMSRQLRAYRKTHMSRLLTAQRTAQATIDAFPDPVVVVDPEGRVELANPAARRVLGVVAPDEGEDPAWVWRPPEALRQPLADAIRSQRPYVTESFDQVVSFRIDGVDHDFLPQILSIQDPYGYTMGASVVLNDVTRFRLLDQLKGDLVATVSHELKTPLTGVRLALHVLLEETVGSLTPKQTELLVDARDNTERLVRMIEHLLALARLEEGHEALELRPEDPESLLRAAADAARGRARDRHLDLTVEAEPGLPPIAVDQFRLARALGNLIDNALTYTDPGGRITLQAVAEGADTVRLSVADTGRGIPAQALPHVFDRFFRLSGQSRGHGTGLGLAIVREIVEAHHGKVAVDSVPGRGTVFKLSLPVWRA